MNITNVTSADQVIPISKARASLPSLIDEVAKRDYFLLSRKYQPKAALVDLAFLDKLLIVYTNWKREQDFTKLEQVREIIPDYSPSQINKDIEYALKKIRHPD